MLLWVVAAAAGLAAAATAYPWRAVRWLPTATVAALCRAVAAGLVAALLLDAPAGAPRQRAPLVALDVSSSWRRGAPDSLWRTAAAAAVGWQADSLFLFGDSLRAAGPSGPPAVPQDVASRVRPAVARAVAAGRPLVVVTDGELDDAFALDALPAGSRVVVFSHAARPDAALTAVSVPRIVTTGDSVDVRLVVSGGAGGAEASKLSVWLASRLFATVTLERLLAGSERAVLVRGAVTAPPGPTLLRATVASAGDAEPRNDTLAAAIDVARGVGAVFASTAPDYDARFALALLRGTLAIPTRGFFRVAPGQWRADGMLTPVAEAEVRRALRAAPMAVLHGDTGVFGAPRRATTGALALLVPQAADGDWYVVAAGGSPLTAALAGIALDSLPPVATGGRPPAGDWRALEVALNRRGERRAVAAGSESPRRVAVVAASGLWRWEFRGGPAADAFAAFWGPLFDWLAAARADPRAALPADASTREGEPVRWRRGNGGTADVALRVTRRGSAATDTLALHFSADGRAESPPLPAGIYDVDGPGGRSLLVVNRSREWLPRRATAGPRRVGGSGAGIEGAPPLRGLWWVYAVAVVLLCSEWLLRRRVGMR